MNTVLIMLSAVLSATTSSVSTDKAAHQSPYAGQEAREIKSLSQEDIAELRRGGGWGLAKAAELNGIPGPAHVLEIADALALTEDQILQISGIYEEMKADAIRQGNSLIEIEAELERTFETRSITKEKLRSLLNEIAATRSELQYTHLSAHLALLPILSEAQRAKYNALRGYAADPCASVPEGHDPALWRRHNNCE